MFLDPKYLSKIILDLQETFSTSFFWYPMMIKNKHKPTNQQTNQHFYTNISAKSFLNFTKLSENLYLGMVNHFAFLQHFYWPSLVAKGHKVFLNGQDDTYGAS